MKLIGYVEKLPIQSGDKILVPKGVVIRYRSQSKPAKRTHHVVVHHVLNGYTPDEAEKAYQKRHGGEANKFNPTVVWAGSGGYWCEADMNDVLRITLENSA